MKKAIGLLMILIIAVSLSACNWGVGDTISRLNYEGGTWNDGVYNSKFLNTSITPTDSWIPLSEKEIAVEKLMIVKDSMNDSDATEEEIARGIEYELKLTNETSHSYMNIVHKDMDIIYSMVYTEEDFMSAYQKNMQQISNEDMKILSMSDPEWVDLGGNQWHMIEMEYSYLTTIRTYQRIYLRKIGTYMTTLTMSVVDKAEFEELEDMFGAYIEQ